MGAGDRPSGPADLCETGFTPRKLTASKDGFPAAVRAFLFEVTPGPIRTAFGAWPRGVHGGPRRNPGSGRPYGRRMRSPDPEIRHNGSITIIGNSRWHGV